MEVRWLRKEEVGDAISLLQESFPVVTTVEKVLAHINEKNRFLVAVEENVLVGIILIRTDENFVEDLLSFHLQNVCVRKDYRNRGIASLMLQKVEKIAQEEDIDYIDLTSSNYREAAQHMYLKNGYEKRESCLFRRRISDKEF